MIVTKQLTVPIDFHSIFSILLKSMATVNCLVTHILQTGLEQLESELMMTEFSFLGELSL